MSRSIVAFLLPPVLLLAPASAQDAPKPPAKDERATHLLREAVQKMAGLPSFSVRTTESHKDPVGAGMGIPGGAAEDKEVEAVFGPDFASASIDNGDHEVVFHHGRMAAKTAKGSWVLRRGLLADGEPLPFIVDPLPLWSVLDRLAGSATSGGPATVKELQVETVKVEVSGDLARELTWTGAFPLPKGGLGGVAFFAIGGGAFKQPPPEVTYQLEIAIDPTSRLIQRIKASGQRLDAAGGRHVVFMGGGGIVQEEEEEPEEEEAKEKLEKQKPKEKEGAEKKEARPMAGTVTVFGGPGGGGGEDGDAKKAKPSMAFQMSFRDHGTAKPSVPDAARAAFQIAPAAPAEKSDK